MQRFWSRLAVELGKHAIIVGVVVGLITLVLGAGINKLEFATGQDSYLNKTDQVYKDSVAYQDLFGGQAMLTVISMDEGHTVAELFTPDGIEQFTDFHDALTESGQTHGVITPLTALEFDDALVASDDGDPTHSIAGAALVRALGEEEEGSPEAEARSADAQVTLERLTAVPEEERTLDNPEWVDFLLFDNQGDIRISLRPFFPDTEHAQVIVRLPGNEDIETEGAAAQLVQDEAAKFSFPNSTMVTTGAPVLLRDINDYLRGGMLTLSAIAIGIMILILLVFFNVRWRLLPMAVILFGVIWAFGLAGYLGIPLTIVTIAGLPVLLGIGIDYAIQMHARVEEEVILDRADHPIQETARGLGPALLVVTFDAIFAFAALRFAKVPMIRQFGLLLAVGIAVICLASIILPLAALGIREFRSPTTGKDFSEGYLGRFVVRLGSLPAWAAIPLAVASLAVFLGGLSVEDDLELQTDPIQWVNQESGTIQDIREVEEQVGSSSELGVFAKADDVFTDEFTEFAHDFQNDALAEYPDDLLTASSIEAAVGGLLIVPGASDVAPTGEEVQAAYDVAPDRHPGVDGQPRRHRVQHDLPGRPELAGPAGGGRAPAPGGDRPARGHLGHAVGPGRRRGGPARQPRSQPGGADLPVHPVRLPLPRHPAPLGDPIPAVPGARAGRGGDGLAGGLCVRPQAEPDDRRRRAAGDRRLHGVHLPDPLAVRRGAPAGPRAPGGHRRSRGPHRSGLHRVGHDRHRRRRRAVVLVAARCCGTSGASWP